jgi:carbon monoxide dehydrogenase subunit G
MSVSKYVSEVKTINQNNEVVFRFLSDFNNLGGFFNDHMLAQISEQIPGGSIEDFRSDSDSCHFTIKPLGAAGFVILEREESKVIKIGGDGKMPFELYIWVQIVPQSAYQCKIRLTLHAHLNVMMKMMLGSKMQGGVDKLAEALTHVSYR